jgi:CDP-diacylglycerol--serine O-phosphatidyltransferase
LARFNVQARFVDHRFFVGMPTPGGAAYVVSIILCHPNQPTSELLIYSIAIGLLLVGGLMISNVRFPSSKKCSKPKRSSNLTTACIVISLLGAILKYGSFLLLLYVVYLFVTFAINLGWKLGWQKVKPPER